MGFCHLHDFPFFSPALSSYPYFSGRKQIPIPVSWFAVEQSPLVIENAFGASSPYQAACQIISPRPSAVPVRNSGKRRPHSYGTHVERNSLPEKGKRLRPSPISATSEGRGWRGGRIGGGGRRPGREGSTEIFQLCRMFGEQLLPACGVDHGARQN